VLAYDYSAGSARLDDLPEFPISPHLYVLCDRCATSLRAPRGWILDDRRTPAQAEPAPAAPGPPAEDVKVPVEASVSALSPQPEVHEEGQRQLAFGYSS
jgi:hypothetical protein